MFLTKHTHYWNKIGSDKQQKLHDRAEIIHTELLEAGLDDHVEKIAGTGGEKWREISSTMQAIQNNTDYYIDRVMNNLPQSRLDSDAWRSSSEDEDE